MKKRNVIIRENNVRNLEPIFIKACEFDNLNFSKIRFERVEGVVVMSRLFDVHTSEELRAIADYLDKLNKKE